MGKLFDAAQQVDRIIARKGLDPFVTKGAISMRTGFLLGFIEPDDLDNPERLQQLTDAVLEVLGESLGA